MAETKTKPTGERVDAYVVALRPLDVALGSLASSVPSTSPVTEAVAMIGSIKG